MEYRRLGQTGLRVSQIGLGAMTFGGQTDERTSMQIIDAAIDAGVNFIDTADVYTNGHSEAIVGEALEGKRDRVVIATKVRGRVGDGPNDEGLSRAHIMKAVEDSLRRLRTDYIDLYQVHSPDSTTPLVETLRTLDDLVRQGKVRYIGCSNFRAWQVCKALWAADVASVEQFISVQLRYNLLFRAVEREMLPFCDEIGIGAISYSPLAGGALSGKYQRGAAPPEGTRGANNPMFQRILNSRNFDIIERLEDIANSRDRALVDLALGWVLATRSVSCALIGATTMEQLNANLSALSWRPSEEDLREVEDAAAFYY